MDNGYPDISVSKGSFPGMSADAIFSVTLEPLKTLELFNVYVRTQMYGKFKQ